MSDFVIHPIHYSQSNSMRRNYSPESDNEFDESTQSNEHRNSSPNVDEKNIIMKTPQSLDDLLDIDEQNGEDQHDNENDDDPNDDDSTHLSLDDANLPDATRQKKSRKKNGKPLSIVK